MVREKRSITPILGRLRREEEDLEELEKEDDIKELGRGVFWLSIRLYIYKKKKGGEIMEKIIVTRDRALALALRILGGKVLEEKRIRVKGKPKTEWKIKIVK